MIDSLKALTRVRQRLKHLNQLRREKRLCIDWLIPVWLLYVKLGYMKEKFIVK